MRDSNAPIINGFDCSGLVSRYSLRCEQFFAERGDTARLLDGASQTDVFPRKIRLSWTLNSVSSKQFADFNAALDTSDTINLVSAVAYDPTRDALCSGNFYVTRPAFPFALAVTGSPISQAGAELILDQQGALDWVSVTPPTKLAYDIGDTFDADGFRVTLTDDKDSVTDITSECSLSIADGDLLPDAGNVPVSVTYHNAHIGAFTLSVATSEAIAGGDWWTLHDSGLLDIYCVGDMPNYRTSYPYTSAPWSAYLTSGRHYSAVIRNCVTSVGSGAFLDKRYLRYAIIADSVTSIGGKAFAGCTNLWRVTIPESVVSIGKEAFLGCRNVSVQIKGNITLIPDGLFDECYYMKSFTIPDSVTVIGNRAFAACHMLGSILIPDGVTSIGSSAFNNCAALTSVTIPNGVRIIDYNTFSSCGKLSYVKIPASVITIRDYAFDRTALTSVTISRNCTVGTNAFPDNCVISYYEDEEAAP